MRIREIRELRVPLNGQISNAVVNFAEHDVSLVAVISDVVRNGRPVIGYAFNSIGRFAQSGILRDRVIPRVLSAQPCEISDDLQFDCAAIFRHAFRNEKPGGHGDRASAIGAIELAFWDLNAKLRDEPAYATIARHYGRDYSEKVHVYAAGGYYSDLGKSALHDELNGYIEQGFDAFKIKIGGAPLDQDMERVDVALKVCGNGARLAVDANGRFDFATAMAYARQLEPLGLRWYEEIGDPLDFGLNASIAQHYGGAIATGENLFSVQDVKNLLAFGGMRPMIDVFQMDAGLSYGLGHFSQIIDLMESCGFSRTSSFPHGGHLINLHIAAGLNLGGCEAYPNVFQPFGGYSPQCQIADGFIKPADHPGFGLEAKPEMQAALLEISQ
jgi:L-alanine-DL-glutamate epimerase-like enolase superfamily enzyme